MSPEHQRHEGYLRSLISQVLCVEDMRDHLARNKHLHLPQYRVLLLMLAQMEGEIACTLGEERPKP